MCIIVVWPYSIAKCCKTDDCGADPYSMHDAMAHPDKIIFNRGTCTPCGPTTGLEEIQGHSSHYTKNKISYMSCLPKHVIFSHFLHMYLAEDRAEFYAIE